MKKAGIFAAVIAAVLLFMHFYNYKLFGYTEDAMYVIQSEQAVPYLKNGVEEDEAVPDIELKCYDASTPLYTRGNKYFVGEEYDSIDLSYPVYMNEGNFLYSFSDEMNLIATDFTQLNAYDGLYVADGHSYNRGREQADPEEFVLLSTQDGLYMNVQDMVIHSQAREQKIGINSLMNLTPERISYYQFDKGIYRYEEYRDLIGASVTIGSLTISYDELLTALNGLREMADTKPENPGAELPEKETVAETEAFSAKEQDKEELVASLPMETEVSEAEEELEGNDGISEILSGEEVLPDHPPIPGDRIKWDFPAGGEDGEGDDSENGGNPGQGGSSDSEGGSGSEGGDGSDGSGDSGSSGGDPSEPGFQKPEASLSDFRFGVYTAETTLSITDPNFLIYKGVRLIFYKKGETRASYRKLYRTSGDLLIEPLAPDTKYEVEGYFEYQHPQAGRVKEVFLERSYQGQTLPVSALSPLEVEQEPDDVFYPNAIQIKDFQIVSGDEMEAGTPSEPQEPQTDTAQYISSVQMNFEKSGAVEWNSPQAVLGSSLTKTLKKGEPVIWKTADILDSNSSYTYHLKFYDRFGNLLPLTDTSKDSGKTRTSKTAPKVVLRIEKSSDANRLEVKMELTNRDKAEFIEDGKKVNPYLYVTYTNRPDAPILFTLDGTEGEISRYELKKNSETLVFTSLLPSTSYTIWVRGSYDLEDGNVYKDQVIGEILTTTDSLSSLGTVSFLMEAKNVKSTSAEITASLQSTVNSALYPYLSDLVFKLNGDEEYSCTLYKEDLENISIAPGETAVIPGDLPAISGSILKQPVISVTLPSGSEEKTAWEAIFSNGTLTFSFEEGSLLSASSYKAELRTEAVRGSGQGNQVMEEVTGRYYHTSFRTLKMPVYVSYEMSFVNSSKATFYNLRVHDPDGAVLNENLVLRVRKKSNGQVVEIRPITVSQLNAMADISFSGLEDNVEYNLEIVAQEYNEGYTNVSKQLQKQLLLKDDTKISFRAKNSLWGSLTMDSMKSQYISQDASDGIGVESINLFDLNDVVYGVSVDSSGNEILDNTYSASGYIPVEKGEIYLLGGGMEPQVYEYDENQEFLLMRNAGGIYRTSEDAAYVRVRCTYQNFSAAFFSKPLYAGAADKPNLIKTGEKGNIIYGEYIDTYGNPKENDKWAVTDYIAIEPSTPYIRLDYGTHRTVSSGYQDIFYYDENKTYISRARGSYMYYQNTAPDNARYVRLNVEPAYAEQLFYGRLSKAFYGPNLLESATWNDGMYVTGDNSYRVQTYDYLRYSDFVAVEPTAVYRAKNWAGLQVFDKNKVFLGYVSGSGTCNIRMPEEAAYVRVNVDFKEDYSTIPELRQSAPAADQGNITMGVRVRLEDTSTYLGEQPEFTLEYRITDADGKEEEWSETYQVDSVNRWYDNVIYKEKIRKGCQYTITQTVVIGGNRIVLDTVSVGTATTVNVIKSEAALKAVCYRPMEDYIVAADIEVIRSDLISWFYGAIDFRGHEIRMRNQNSLFTNIWKGAVVENLVADMAIENDSKTIRSRGLLCDKNWGTIQNVVLRMAAQNDEGENYHFGGLSYLNYGVIDRFAVQLTGNVYGRTYVGAAASQNFGQITNGYLVSEDKYRFTMNPEANLTDSRAYRGGLVGYNAIGNMENLYSAVVVEEKHRAEGKVPNDIGYSGLVTGGTRTSIHNVFGVGMTLSNDLPLEKEGPVVGIAPVSQDMIGNVSYVETMAFEKPHYANIYNNQVTISSLWDKTWMDTAINKDNAFDTAMAADGFYPHVVMSSYMTGKQPIMNLPNQYVSSEPKILALNVLDQNDKTARVKIEFENRSRLHIGAVEIAIMDMSTENQRVFYPGAAADVIEQGTEEDGTYYAIIEIHSPVYYRSKYYIDSFTVGIKGNESTYHKVTPTEREKTEMIVEFYDEIGNLEEWRKKLNSKVIDNYGNYRLTAAEYDFGNLQPGDYKSDYRIFNTFYGKIDGSSRDAEGNLRVAVLKNMNLGSYDSLINKLSGSLKYIRVENLNINLDKSSTDRKYKGLITSVSGGLVDHVQVDSARINGPYRTGVIAGYMEQGAVISNSSVTNSEITTIKPSVNAKISAGGITGWMSGSTIENCFVEGLLINGTEGLDAEGIGGLVGYGSSNPAIENCYVVGDISSGFRNTGGIIGYLDAASTGITNCYSKVDIDAYGTFVGGIVGYLGSNRDMSGNLSLGSLFTHSKNSDGVHRLAGYHSIGRFPENYAFDQQMFNNKVDPNDKDDVEKLVSEADLRSENTYRNMMKWGDSTWSFQWEREGEAQGIANGYLPLLNDTEGKILPGQTPVPIGASGITVETQAFGINSSAEKEYHDKFGLELTVPFETAYELRYKITYDKERFEPIYEETRMEGMNLNMNMHGQNTYTVTLSSEGDGEIIRMPFVVAELGGDVYCLNTVFQSKTDPDIRIAVNTSIEVPENMLITRDIANAAQWNEVMSKYGFTYGNFRLTGDIIPNDASGPLVSGVKINQLAGNDHTIKGVKYEITGARDALIDTCLSEISNVSFEDISWEVLEANRGSSFENIGIIGMNQGTISDVTFKNIRIVSGKGNYTGCVGYNVGTLQKITLEDITVDSLGSRVGGLAGYTMMPVSEITASGKCEMEGDEYSSTYSVTGNAYVGGLIGQGQVHNGTKVTGILVTGTNRIPGTNTNTDTDVHRIGGLTGDGNIPVAGQSIAESWEARSTIRNSVVQVKDFVAVTRAPYYVGGLAGNGNCYYGEVVDCIIMNERGEYTGGAAGNGYSERTEVKSTKVTSGTFAGGISGQGYGSYGTVDQVEVEALEAYAGGVVGKTISSVNYMTVDRSEISAPTGAGGIVGQSMYNLSQNLLSRSIVSATGDNAGGILGDNGKTQNHISGNGVISSKITSGKNPETGEGNAGGIIGRYDLAGEFYSNYTIYGTEVETEGTNAGGLIGYSSGGNYYRCYTTAKVTAEENAGGFIGRLVSEHTEDELPYRTMALSRSYSYGNVSAKRNAAGFVGLCSADAGLTVPARENFYGLLAMGTVTAGEESQTDPETAGGDFFLNMEGGQNWQGNYLRIFSGAQLNGQKAFEMQDKSFYDQWWDTYKPTTADGTREEGNEELLETLLVTSKNLHDRRLYENTVEKGGMEWGAGWDLDGLGRMEESQEETTTYKPSASVTVDGTEWGTGKSVVVAGPGPVNAKIDMEGKTYNWYRVYVPRYESPLGSTNITTQETPLAGRGYYIGRVGDGTPYSYTPIIKLTGPGYLPYLTQGSVNARKAQEGLVNGADLDQNPDYGLEVSDPLKLHDELDKLYYGGIVIPEDSGDTTLLAPYGEMAEAAVYPSGADTVNIDLGGGYEAFDRIRILCGSQVVCETSEIQRAYTVSYDYRQPLTVTVCLGAEEKTAVYDPTMLRRTVMVWGEDYFYTCDGGLYNSEGLMLDVPILNLYGGKALGENGTIYDLEEGTERTFAINQWNSEMETVSLWEDAYDGSRLKVPGGFTEIYSGDTSQPEIREQQLFVKNERLYSLTGSSLNKGFVVDDYNGQIFASFLDEEGSLRDSGDPLHTPEEFSRRGIAHMTTSAGSNVPYLLVRYTNGAAKGFNYVTGEALEIENAFSDISFLDFASDFAGEFFGGAANTNAQFADLKKLESQLTLAPITEGQLDAAFAAMAGADSKTDVKEEENGSAAENSDESGEGAGTESSEKTGSKDAIDERKGPGDEEKNPSGEIREGAEEAKELTGETGEDAEEAKEPADETGEGAEEAKGPSDETGEGAEEAKGPSDETGEGAEEAKGPSDETGDGTDEASKAAGGTEQTSDGADGAADGAEQEADGAADGAEQAADEAVNGAEQTADGTDGAADGAEQAADGTADADTEDTGEAEQVEGGENQTDGKRAEETSKLAKVTYVYSFDADKQTAQLYRAGDLLTKSEEQLMTEEKKVELLKSTGLMTEDYVIPKNLQNEENRKGLLIFALTAVLALGLSGFLIYRRKRY